jgi:AraC-like DNA-binding protein
MVNRFYRPTPALGGLVKGYQIMHVQTPADAPLQRFPFPPQALQSLSFCPRDPITRYHHATGRTDKLPGSILVGPHVSRVDLTLGRDHLIVVTFFEFGGLHRLLGIPMYEFPDDSFDTTLLWGEEVRIVDQQLRETDNYDQMQQIVEAFLLRRLRQKLVEKQPVDSALQLLLETARPLTVDFVAEQACLSARQFERKCYERLGYGPKMLNRLVRFNRAVRLKERHPDLGWLDVALICGYYDFQHLRRDFKSFALATPTLLLQEETRSQIRIYSSHNF